MITPKDFYFLRHGETDWNLVRRGMGQKDIPLNERGQSQAVHAGLLLKNESIDLICHSPLARARRTAEIVAEMIGAPLSEIPELIECAWGEKEGEIRGKWTENWIQGAEISGAESYESFLRRAVGGINKAIAFPGKVLIVSHGGVFWSVQKFAQLGDRFDLPNCVPVFLRAPAAVDSPWGMVSLDPDEEV